MSDDKLIGAGKAGANQAAKQAALLEGLKLGLKLCEARGLAQVSKNVPGEWRKANPKFAAAYDLAIAEGIGTLATEARKRAVEGTRKPVFHGGKVVQWFNPDTNMLEPFYVLEKSDTLLMFLLRSRDPETYCDRVRAEKFARRWRAKDGDGKGDAIPMGDVVDMLAKVAAAKAATAEAKAPAP